MKSDVSHASLCSVSSNRSKSDQQRFRTKVLHTYCSDVWSQSNNGQARCLLLNKVVAAYFVHSAHVVSHRMFRKYPELVRDLKISGAFDPRNGIPLFDGVEWAFDHGYGYFDEDYCFHIVNHHIREISVVKPWKTYTQLFSKKKLETEQNGNITKQVDPYDSLPIDIHDTTFDAIDGQQLSFLVSFNVNEHGPFRRGLFLHAKMALLKAQERGWIFNSKSPSIKFCSPEVRDNVARWLDKLGDA